MSSVVMSEFATSVSRSGFGGVFTAAPTSVNSTAIIDGTIATEDIKDGAITEAKFSSELQTNLLNFTRRLINLEEPGWYGNFKIKNANQSNPFSFTFTIHFDTFNIVTNTTDTFQYGESITLTHNHHYDLVLPIRGRLTNQDTYIRLNYSTSGGDITDTTRVGIGIDSIEEGNILIVVDKNYIHNGNIELTVEINN